MTYLSVTDIIRGKFSGQNSLRTAASHLKETVELPLLVHFERKTSTEMVSQYLLGTAQPFRSFFISNCTHDAKVLLKKNMSKALSMDELLATSEIEQLKPGDVIEGKVLSVRKHEVWVDLGAHGVGVVMRREIGPGTELEKGQRYHRKCG